MRIQVKGKEAFSTFMLIGVRIISEFENNEVYLLLSIMYLECSNVRLGPHLASLSVVYLDADSSLTHHTYNIGQSYGDTFDLTYFRVRSILNFT